MSRGRQNSWKILMVAHVRDDGLGSGSNGGERINGSEKRNREISEANSSDNV